MRTFRGASVRRCVDLFLGGSAGGGLSHCRTVALSHRCTALRCLLCRSLFWGGRRPRGRGQFVASCKRPCFRTRSFPSARVWLSCALAPLISFARCSAGSESRLLVAHTASGFTLKLQGRCADSFFATASASSLGSASSPKVNSLQIAAAPPRLLVLSTVVAAALSPALRAGTGFSISAVCVLADMAQAEVSTTELTSAS